MLVFDTLDRCLQLSPTSMASPVPLSKAAEVFPQLADLMSAGKEIDEFSLARFERAAQASMEATPKTAFQLLGMVAACRWDVDGVHANFQEALTAGSGYAGHANYAAALRAISRTREAATQVECAAKLAPENLNYLREAVAIRFCLGDWESTLRLIDTFESRSSEKEEHFDHMREIIQFSSELGLRESTVQECMNVTFGFLANERIGFVGVADSVDSWSDEGSIYFDVLVRASEDRAAELDEQLTPLLFEGVGDLQLGVFGLTIRYFSDADTAS